MLSEWCSIVTTQTYLGDLRLDKLLLSSLDPFIRLCTRDNEREGDLPAVFVRYPNDTNVRYERVAQEMAFEFGWRDLETANFHDLLDAVNNKNVIIRVDDSFISCADPSREAKSESTVEQERRNHIPIYESLFSARGENRFNVELCVDGVGSLLTLVHCLYTSAR